MSRRTYRRVDIHRTITAARSSGTQLLPTCGQNESPGARNGGERVPLACSFPRRSLYFFVDVRSPLDFRAVSRQSGSSPWEALASPRDALASSIPFKETAGGSLTLKTNVAVWQIARDNSTPSAPAETFSLREYRLERMMMIVIIIIL